MFEIKCYTESQFKTLSAKLNRADVKWDHVPHSRDNDQSHPWILVVDFDEFITMIS